MKLSYFLKSGKRVKINKYVLGIEVEVCYLIKKIFMTSLEVKNIFLIK